MEADGHADECRRPKMVTCTSSMEIIQSP